MTNDLSLAVPAEPESARIVRAVANAVAANESYAFDALGDIDLAIDEGIGALLEAGGSGSLQCGISVENGSLVFEMSAAGSGQPWPHPGWDESLGALVLNAVASDVDYLRMGERPGIRFRIARS